MLITSAHSLAATSAPRVRATHRPPPSATAPHRLPGTWLLRILPATTRIFLVKDVFAPTSIPGRHSSAAGSSSRCSSEIRTHSREKDPLLVAPDKSHQKVQAFSSIASLDGVQHAH